MARQRATRLDSRDRALLLAVGVAALLLAGVGTLAAETAAGTDRPGQEVPDEFIEPKPGENVLWPYTSKRRAVEGRTLAINVIVHGDADRLRYYLSERTDATWNETEREGQADPAEHDEFSAREVNGTVLDWTAARGAKRYLYVHDRNFTVAGANASVRRPHWAVPFAVDQPRDGGGRWVDETYQLHDGTYFGTRYHLRVYESPYERDDWVAIQAHSDHWDWFRLRHTVDGTERAQTRLESEFMGRPFVDDVWRMYLHNDDRSSSDGWASVIVLEDRGGVATIEGTGRTRAGSEPTSISTATLIGFAVTVAVAAVGTASVRRTGRSVPPGRSREAATGAADGQGRERQGDAAVATGALDGIRGALVRRLDRQQFALLDRAVVHARLFGALAVLYLGVRVGGLAIESTFPALSPRVIAAGLYPLLALGLPICAYVLGRTLSPVRAFAVAAVGVETAVVVDYLSLEIAVLPIDVVIHRIGVAIALGLLAAGATPPGSRLPAVNRWLAAGVLLWVFLLIAPLVGWL